MRHSRPPSTAYAAFAYEAAPDAGVLAGLCDTLAAALDESGQRKLLDEMGLHRWPGCWPTWSASALRLTPGSSAFGDSLQRAGRDLKQFYSRRLSVQRKQSEAAGRGAV